MRATGVKWAAVVIVLLLTTAACRGDSTPSVHGNRVLVVGDSIMADSRFEVTNALVQDGWNVTVEAVATTAILYWVPRVSLLLPTINPDVVTVELGTNESGEVPTVGAHIDALMERLRDVPVVFWLNIREEPPYPPAASSVNLAIEQAAVRWPNMRVVDFDKFFAGHPEWLQPDGIHPNAQGAVALANLLRSTLATVRRESERGPF